MTTVLFGAAGWVAGAAGAWVLRGWGLRPLWCGAAVAALWMVAPRPLSLVLGWFGVLLSAIDLRHHRLPDVLTLPLYPVMAVVLADEAVSAALGCLVFGLSHLVVRMISTRAMGGGDVKLAGSLGAALATTSWDALWLAAVLASVLTLVAGLVRRERAIPHGPGLLAATWVFTL